MNFRDSDSAGAMLQAAGWTSVNTETEADLIILNTCSVRDQAERKEIGKLGFLGKLKRVKPNLMIGIMGCMAQSRGEELLAKIKHLDFAIGTDRIHEIPEIVANLLKERRKVGSFERAGADTPGIDAHRLDEMEKTFSAFVSIARGCSRYCSYCIVPFVRGPERSRNPQSVIAECQMLAKRGVSEIFLLGQNVSAFGWDNMAPPKRDAKSPFAELLRNIAKIDGVRRIRFTSPHPAYFSDELIQVIADEKKVCKCIHLPLQSGSDRILKMMNRPYDSARYMQIIHDLKAKVPEIAFTTDVIVGFPTETEDDFIRTRDIMNEVGYDNAYIFKYSPRKGTRSAKMEDDVPQNVKEERNQILLKDLEIRAEACHQQFLNRRFEILVEGQSKRNATTWCGRTDTFRQTVFSPDSAVKPGDYVTVKIVRTTATTLYGELEL